MKHKKKVKIDKSRLTREEIDYRLSFDFIAHFDGSFSFGKMGYGGFIVDNDTGKEVFSFTETVKLNNGTVNVAEYLAVIEILKALEAGCEGKRILVMGDSLLVVNQLKKRFNINSVSYKPYAERATEILSQSKNHITIMWIPREKNQRADELSKCH